VTTTRGTPLSVDLASWPGVVLRVSPDGDVIASNGRLEALLDADVVGRRVVDLLDHDSSLAKWNRLVADANAPARTWELIFCAEDRVLETGAFSVVRAADDSGCWLVEHPATPRLTQLAAEVSAVNAELATAQRRLIIEQARLARALAEVERSNRALDEFAHVVSHDLKAPVRAIREYAGFLLDAAGPGTDEERVADLRRIHELSARMRRMIDAALAYARAGHAGDRVEPVDPRAVLDDVIGFLAPPKDVTIRITTPMPAIVTERTPFEQVFRNLLSNAIAYRRASDAVIEIAAREDGDMCEITVADNGPGIPEGAQARVWHLFHTTRPGEGSGLGLALVKRIVEAHHGSVALRSTSGHGATFIVRWPKQPPHPIAAKGATSAAAR